MSDFVLFVNMQQRLLETWSSQKPFEKSGLGKPPKHQAGHHRIDHACTGDGRIRVILAQTSEVE